jgi:putative aminopeptidase FrvX
VEKSGCMNDKLMTPRPPRVGAAQFKLLERLCTACAVSGDEGEVRKIVLEEVRSYADDVKVDALGNVLVTRHGKTDQPRLKVMLDAHMDEVGLMITNDEGDGIYRFDTVGGVNSGQLVGKSVWIGREHVPGVIGTKPIHLTERNEIKSKISLDVLRIDTGPVAGKVKVGDRAAFATPFTRIGPAVRAKALDDRLGVSILIDLLKNAPETVDLLLSFSVQEEIGLRGARVAAYAFDPDMAIAVDSTPAYDLPTWDDTENTTYNTRLGEGPALYIADSATLSDPRLVRFFVETAETAGIPYQFRQPGGGGTDAGAIHRQRRGIPSISISVPGRYHHTPASIARVSDWQNTLALVFTVLHRLTPDVLVGERQ